MLRQKSGAGCLKNHYHNEVINRGPLSLPVHIVSSVLIYFGEKMMEALVLQKLLAFFGSLANNTFEILMICYLTISLVLNSQVLFCTCCKFAMIYL